MKEKGMSRDGNNILKRMAALALALICLMSVCAAMADECDHRALMYKSDAQGHWAVCRSCGQEFSKSGHTYVSGSCIVCGYNQPGASSNGSNASSAKQPAVKPAATKKPVEKEKLTAEWMKDGTAKGTVEVLQTGLANCVILDGENAQTVATSELKFGSVAADWCYAVIYAPKTGKANLRSTWNDQSEILCECPAGTVLAVLVYERDHVKVNYDGIVGYIKDTSVRFFGSRESRGTATVQLNGSTDGSKAVTLRLNADQQSLKIGEVKTGTKVTVLGMQKDFYEVETDGLRGFIRKDLLISE